MRLVVCKNSKDLVSTGLAAPMADCFTKSNTYSGDRTIKRQLKGRHFCTGASVVSRRCYILAYLFNLGTLGSY